MRSAGPGDGVSVHVLCRTPADHPHRFWDRHTSAVHPYPFIEVAPDQYFLRPVVAEMIAIAHGFGHDFTAAQFRDKLDNGRKVAIQILEFFDRHGVTIRRGDLRLQHRLLVRRFGVGLRQFNGGRDLPQPRDRISVEQRIADAANEGKVVI